MKKDGDQNEGCEKKNLLLRMKSKRPINEHRAKKGGRGNRIAVKERKRELVHRKGLASEEKRWVFTRKPGGTVCSQTPAQGNNNGHGIIEKKGGGRTPNSQEKIQAGEGEWGGVVGVNRKKASGRGKSKAGGGVEGPKNPKRHDPKRPVGAVSGKGNPNQKLKGVWVLKTRYKNKSFNDNKGNSNIRKTSKKKGSKV